MSPRAQSSRGYSLIELLAVVAILAILAIVGVTMIGDHGTNAVREVMDEMEGSLMSAQKLAAATGQDVTIATQGTWSDLTNPLLMAQGVGQTPANVIANGLTSANSFRLALTTTASGPILSREHAYAGIVTEASPAWWTTAMGADAAGKTNADLTQVEPFKDQTGFTGLLGDSTKNLFQGGSTSSPPATVTVSGTNKRFTTNFWVEVVALRGGGPVAGGAMGVLVVLANGATVYKFYNPGVINGNGLWRRI